MTDLKTLLSLLLVAAVAVLAVSASPCAAPAAEEAESSEHEAAAGEGEGEGAAHAGPDLAVYNLVVFLIVLFVLVYFGAQPLGTMLARREENTLGNIQAAETAYQEARNLLQQHEARLASADQEIESLLEGARRDAEHAREEMIARAKVDAQAEWDRAAREVRNATDAALKNISERAANLAVEMAGTLVRERLTEAEHGRLVDEGVDHFSRLVDQQKTTPLAS